MNLELYITILESSVEHLNKLQNLLTIKLHTLSGSISSEAADVENENARMILLEIAETAEKLEKGANSLL